jgi:hypothetical protein
MRRFLQQVVHEFDLVAKTRTASERLRISSVICLSSAWWPRLASSVPTNLKTHQINTRAAPPVHFKGEFRAARNPLMVRVLLPKSLLASQRPSIIVSVLLEKLRDVGRNIFLSKSDVAANTVTSNGLSSIP